LTSDRINLEDWNDNHILSWIVDTQKNSFEIRRFLVEYFLWKHRRPYTPIHLYRNITIKGKAGIKEQMDFWVRIFRERKLL
jgi:hypothetical protein